MATKLDKLAYEPAIIPEYAYCLGGIVSAAKSYTENKTVYWVLPVIHNPVKGTSEKEAQQQKIDQHQKILQKIVRKLGGQSLSKGHPTYQDVLPGNKRGFVFIFSSKSYLTFESLLNFVKQQINGADAACKRAFIVGAFDGRCSFDKNSKMITLDCLTQEGTELIKELLEPV